MIAVMKTITVNISDHAYKQLKDAAERDGTTLAAFARPALEKAAYAAGLAKYAPYRYDEAALAAHRKDVDRVVFGDNG
jgi:hypothetical protein